MRKRRVMPAAYCVYGAGTKECDFIIPLVFGKMPFLSLLIFANVAPVQKSAYLLLKNVSRIYIIESYHESIYFCFLTTCTPLIMDKTGMLSAV